MKVTDKRVQEILQKVSLWFLDESIFELEEDYREGRSDLEVLKDEAEYFLELYKDKGCIKHIDLVQARRVLKETNDGKGNIILVPSFKLKYTQYQIEWAQEYLAEYERLKKLVKDLKKLSIKGVKP